MANPVDARNTGPAAFACLLLVGTLLALSLILAKLADQAGAPRLTFLMVGIGGAGLILTLITAASRQPMPINRRILEYGLASGFLLATPNALGFLAVRHVGAGFLSLSFAFPVLFTWILATAMGLERVRPARLLGVMLGLAGGLILAAAKAGDVSAAPGWALLILAMPMLLAVGNVYRSLRWPSGASPLFLAGLMMLGAALMLLPFVLVSEPGQLPALLASQRITVLLGVEVLVFSVLYLFYFVLQKIAGPVYLSQMGTVAAVVGTLIAVLWLGEAPPPYLGLAGTLVALGTLLFHRGARAGLPKALRQGVSE
ncbi:hypothetical protein Y5W_00092 [Alcanivorax sp. 521-1]|uniref:EamA domain-containing protein n=1 Tax=Alloalcanivorax profundimaris TaxID=2735259 RepID=A0ABS0AL06_9GAMM|nr:DMT family transporter [Alloalcanivorax profundimaris]MBF5054798.1 hypothetical protein [Alloalcanivorax profundimaris]